MIISISNGSHNYDACMYFERPVPYNTNKQPQTVHIRQFSMKQCQAQLLVFNLQILVVDPLAIAALRGRLAHQIRKAAETKPNEILPPARIFFNKFSITYTIKSKARWRPPRSLYRSLVKASRLSSLMSNLEVSPTVVAREILFFYYPLPGGKESVRKSCDSVISRRQRICPRGCSERARCLRRILNARYV